MKYLMSKIIFNFICWLIHFLSIEHALSLIEYLNLKYQYESAFMEKPDKTQDELEKQIQQEYQKKLEEESRQALIELVMQKRQAYEEAKKARELTKQECIDRNKQWAEFTAVVNIPPPCGDQLRNAFNNTSNYRKYLDNKY